MDTYSQEHQALMQAIYRASDLSRETAYALVALTVRHTIADVAAYIGGIGEIEGRTAAAEALRTVCEYLERRVEALIDDDEYVDETALEALFRGGFKS